MPPAQWLGAGAHNGLGGAADVPGAVGCPLVEAGLPGNIGLSEDAPEEDAGSEASRADADAPTRARMAADTGVPAPRSWDRG